MSISSLHILLPFYLTCLILTFATAIGPPKPPRIPCNTCCPCLFHSPQGVVNIIDSHYLVHSISYQMRCLLSTEDVIIVSDSYLTNPFIFYIQNRHWNVDKSGLGRFSDLCTSPEQNPFAIISTKQFLSYEHGFLQKVIPASTPTSAHLKDLYKSTLPGKRVALIFTAGTEAKMISIIRRVDQELELLRSDKKLFWEPRIIFIWSGIQYSSRDIYHETDIHDGSNVTKTSSSSTTSPTGNDLLHSWFQNYTPKFSLNSGIFFMFMIQKGNSSRSQKNLFMSLWEGYNLKGKFILKRVTDHLYKSGGGGNQEETCSSVFRDEPLISMDKVNAYLFHERFQRRENFGQRPLVAVVSDSSKWIELKQKENGSIELVKGGSANMYRDFQTMMNFSEEVIVAERINWGETSSTDFSGTVTGQLNSEAVDISLNQETITPSRGQASAFLQPTYYGKFHAFFLQPSDSTIRNIVTAPFTRSVWIFLFCAWLLTVMVMNCWAYIARRNIMLESYKDLRFIQEVEMWGIAAICQKTWYASPKTATIKITFYLGSILAFVLYAAYSATIVSFLTVQTNPIQSFSDLVAYRYKFSAHKQSEASVVLAQKLVSSFNLSQNVRRVNTEEEISHILIPNNAFLTYPDLFYKTAENQSYGEEFVCTNISTLSVQSVPYKSSMSVKKGSQYHELINQKLLKIIERGLNFRYIKHYEKSRGYICSTQNYNYKGPSAVDPVRFGDVLITFLIIIIGWLVATAMFFTERLLHLRRKYFYLV